MDISTPLASLRRMSSIDGVEREINHINRAWEDCCCNLRWTTLHKQYIYICFEWNIHIYVNREIVYECQVARGASGTNRNRCRTVAPVDLVVKQIVVSDEAERRKR